MTKYKVTVITLDPTSKRVMSLGDSIVQQSISVQFFDAIDGRQSYPQVSNDEILDQNQSILRRFTPLTSGEVGCYLSHFRAIKQAYENGQDRLCLLEDDISINDNFTFILEQIFELPEEFEFVRLMGLKRHKYKVIKSLEGNVNLVRPIKGLCGTQGYTINRRGMEKIIAKGSRIYEPIDKFYDHFWDTDLQCYAVEPHIIKEVPRPTTVAKPDMVKANKPLAKRLKKEWIKFKRSIDRRRYIAAHRDEFYPLKKVR